MSADSPLQSSGGDAPRRSSSARSGSTTASLRGVCFGVVRDCLLEACPLLFGLVSVVNLPATLVVQRRIEGGTASCDRARSVTAEASSTRDSPTISGAPGPVCTSTVTSPTVAVLPAVKHSHRMVDVKLAKDRADDAKRGPTAPRRDGMPAAPSCAMIPAAIAASPARAAGSPDAHPIMPSVDPSPNEYQGRHAATAAAAVRMMFLDLPKVIGLSRSGHHQLLCVKSCSLHKKQPGP